MEGLNATSAATAIKQTSNTEARTLIEEARRLMTEKQVSSATASRVNYSLNIAQHLADRGNLATARQVVMNIIYILSGIQSVRLSDITDNIVLASQKDDNSLKSKYVNLLV